MRVERTASGVEYLGLVTDLLHASREGDPLHGMWEAADFQWWWRRDQHQEPGNQIFEMDGDRPVAAVVLTDWSAGRWQCDLLFTSRRHSEELEQLWPRALQMMENVGADHLELLTPSEDDELVELAVDEGFVIENPESWTCWMPASDRPEVPALPSGFKLQSRAEFTERPHPMAERNGPQVGVRLAECSLYDPDLDLAVFSPEGELAGYSLYWADPITRVGLVEPMRTQDAFQGRGIARQCSRPGWIAWRDLDAID